VVDVVILTWNDGPLLERAVASALGSQAVDVRVWVVDNGSEPPAATADDPRVAVIRNEVNRGVARARNQGAAAGDAPLVCFLDSDARLHPTALRALADALASDGVGLAAPVISSMDPRASAGRAPSLARKAARALSLTSRYAGTPHPAEAASWAVDFAIGACQLIRRSAFEAVGGLDESYFYGPEDVDLCLRLAQAGWTIVLVGAAHCDHPARRRFRKVLTRRGMQHAVAVARHLWRHRHHRSSRGAWQPSTS
jgi:GT2 family glycosyltransferase